MGKREDNARKKKIKRFFVKTVAWIFLIGAFGGIIAGLFNDNYALIFLIFAICFLAWLTHFAEYFEPYTKAYKFEMNFNSFDSIIEYLEKNVSKIGFKRYYNFDPKKAIVYYRLKGTSLSYFFILKQDKILDNKRNTLSGVDDIRDEFIDIIYRELYNRTKLISFFEENFFFIVDEESDVFKKIMDTNVFGEYKQPYIYTGYSLKTHLFYIAQQKEGDYLNYRLLRNKVLKVMNLKMKDRIKG